MLKQPKSDTKTKIWILFEQKNILNFKKKLLFDLELNSIKVQVEIPLCIWGWSGDAMVLGKLPVPGRPSYLE